MSDAPKSEVPPTAALVQELQQIESRAEQIRQRLAAGTATQPWWSERFYATYHVVVGSVLGLVAAGASLLFNVVGSLMMGLEPLRLIKVYLTFPLGEKALSIESGVALSTGVLLYLATGMVFGAILHAIGQRWFPSAPLTRRLGLAAAAGVALWLVNFYAVLSWLQPALFGGRWIVEQIPAPVGAATHLVFTGTLTLLAWLGRFEPPAAR